MPTYKLETIGSMTVTQTLPPLRKKDAFVLSNLSWEQFEAIDKTFSSIPNIKFRYLEGDLEILTISPEHEYFKSTISLLLEAFFQSQRIRFYKWGGPSFGNKTLGALSEPDESYNLNSWKTYPDLVIEVVISSGGVNKLEGYRRMGVLEVWFWEDGLLQIYSLQNNEYKKENQSVLLPDLPVEAFCRYVTYHDQYDAVEEFRQILYQQD